MGRVDGKVAIVTGSAQGMGASHARKLINEGAKVVITDLAEEKGQGLADELGENAMFVKQDVTNEDDWHHVITETEKQFGPATVLVNNAGITTTKSIADTSLNDYMKIFNINQLSVFLGTKAVIPSMKKAGSGSIINISSLNGIVGGAIGYTDTKFAVRGMTKATSKEVAPYGIRANSIHPGAVMTPMLKQEDTKEAVEEFAKTIPMKRMAEPEEISDLVLFLASDESSYSTGSEFVIDGGLTAE